MKVVIPRLRVLFEVVHPAHAWFFAHAIETLRARGDEVCITSRDKDVTLAVLDHLGVPHLPLTMKGEGSAGLFAELVARDRALFRAARRFQPDVLVACNSPCAPHVATLLRRPSIVFEDTEVNRRAHLLYYPFVTEVHSPRAYRFSLGAKHRFYPGYHALSRLHPSRFRADPGVRARHGLPERFVYVRFVAWGADHDRGAARMSAAERVQLVSRLSSLPGAPAVVISSEGPLPNEIAHLARKTSVEEAHHLVASASLVVGESATMTTEAAVLGTPAVYIDGDGRGFTDEIERCYGLCVRLAPRDVGAVALAARRLYDVDRDRHLRARERLLANTIDTGAYVLETIQRVVSEGGARARSRSPASPAPIREDSRPDPAARRSPATARD